MKFNAKSLGVKLWAYFALFAAAIFAVLWLCQTVFLQTSYDRMVIRNIQAAAEQIAAQTERADFGHWLDNLAYENSFLIFLTDAQGNVLYSTDEHSGAYHRETAAALSKAEQARKDFLANISHDLRTPLTMIRGYAEMVRDISWEDEAQRENDLAIIIRETNRLTELVNDILELTALQSQTQAAQYGEVDLSGAAQDVIRQFTPLCEQRGCVIKLELEPGQFVRGEPVQLSRVLYNLIDNAISHAGESQIVHVSLKRAGQTVRVEVQDHGEGIPPEEIPCVWERYFTSKQRKSKREHSGLGLAISKEILLAHGAKFGVNSAIGQGSCFWFEMNVAATVRPH